MTEAATIETAKTDERDGRGRQRDRPEAHVRQRRRGRRGAARRRRDLPARAVRRRHGPVGLGQVDAHAPARRARHARPPARSRSTGASITEHGRQAELTRLRRDRIGFVFQFFNLLPMLTRRGERRAAAPARRRSADGELGRARCSTRVGLADRAAHTPVRALRRPAAARRRRPRARQQAGGGVRRRADRQPRLQDQRRDPRAHAPVGRRVRPDDRDGHARRARRRDRRPRRLPERRPDRRRRAAHLDGRRDPRPIKSLE